jgi:hypothetical protein
MMNEQLSWLTPFSQQVAPGLAWRSRGHGELNNFSFAVEWTAKEKFSDSVNTQAIGSVICCQDILYANEALVFAFLRKAK